MDKKFWDARVTSKLKNNKHKPWNNYGSYVLSNYKKLINYSLELFNEANSEGIDKILKTDLWDTLIEPNRSVVSVLPKGLKEKVWYVDISDQLVRKGINNFGFSRVKRGDIRNLSFKDNEFGLILDCSTIDHIPTKDVKKSLNEYVRIVRYGGVLVVVYARKNLLLRLTNQVGQFLFNTDIFNRLENSFGQYFFADSLFDKYFKENNLCRVRRKLYFGAIMQLPSKNKLVKNLFNIVPFFLFRLLSNLEMLPFVTNISKPISLFGCFIVQKQLNAVQVKEFWEGREKEFKDDRASLWSYKLFNKFIQFEQSLILRDFIGKVEKDDVILDVGCGTGRILEKIARKTKNSLGLDYSSHSLQIAQKRLDKKNLTAFLVNEDLRRFNFKENHFDSVISITALSMLVDKIEYYRVVKKILKSLKPGGEFVIIERFGNQYDPHVIKVQVKEFRNFISPDADLKEIKKVDIVWLRKIYFGFKKITSKFRIKNKVIDIFCNFLEIFFLSILLILELILPDFLKLNSEYFYLRFVKPGIKKH